jgi:hypothetical protein
MLETLLYNCILDREAYGRPGPEGFNYTGISSLYKPPEHPDLLTLLAILMRYTLKKFLLFFRSTMCSQKIGTDTCDALFFL